MVLNAWDGPTDGIIKCCVCGAELLFGLIDWQENVESDDLRVFGLRLVPEGTLDEAVSVCPKGRPVTWPVWVPRWVFARKNDEVAAKNRLERILLRASAPVAVMAWEGGWKMRIISVKDLPGDEDVHAVQLSLQEPRKRARVRDWFQFMGLPRN